jgi:hypothetical protein
MNTDRVSRFLKVNFRYTHPRRHYRMKNGIDFARKREGGSGGQNEPKCYMGEEEEEAMP